MFGLLAAILAAGCGGGAGASPAAGQLTLGAVTDALKAAGIAVVDVADNLPTRDGAWSCVPGTFRLARVSQQAPAAMAQPGDRPAVDILLFATDSQRAAAQSSFGADGQVHVAGCAVMISWIATPHLFGARNVLLFVATDDPATVTAVKNAAARLGG